MLNCCMMMSLWLLLCQCVLSYWQCPSCINWQQCVSCGTGWKATYFHWSLAYIFVWTGYVYIITVLMCCLVSVVYKLTLSNACRVELGEKQHISTDLWLHLCRERPHCLPSDVADVSRSLAVEPDALPQDCSHPCVHALVSWVQTMNIYDCYEYLWLQSSESMNIYNYTPTSSISHLGRLSLLPSVGW